MICPSAPLACAGDQELLMPSGKLYGPVWYSKLIGFLVPMPPYPAGGRRIHNGCLLHSSLCGQNPQ
jgi:hypothetical protein